MDHLYEYVKECIKYTQTEMPSCKGMTDEELFDDVMENVISSVEYYSLENYKRDKEKSENGKEKN